MSIELLCSQCGQRLRVGDEHAGSQARCPQCGAVTDVPIPYRPASQPPPSSQPPVNPYSSPPSDAWTSTPSTGGLRPHRGTEVLLLGIAGIMCCLLCGPIAWLFGSRDLQAMRSGEMDRSGETETLVGMILGIICTVILGVFTLLFIVTAVIAIVRH